MHARWQRGPTESLEFPTTRRACTWSQVWFISVIALLLVCPRAVQSIANEDEAVPTEALRGSLRRANAWLIGKRTRAGFVLPTATGVQEEGSSAVLRFGHTAFGVLALLHSGSTPKDPPIRESLRLLQRQFKDITKIGSDTPRVYAVSLYVLCLAAAQMNFASRSEGRVAPIRSRKLLQTAVNWLVAQGEVDTGLLGYPGRGDISNTCFAAMALACAADLGIGADPAALDRAITGVRQLQSTSRARSKESGGSTTGQGSRTPARGFHYRWPWRPSMVPEPDIRGSVTGAGVAALLALSHTRCTLGVGAHRSEGVCEAIDAGVEWLRQHWMVTGNPIVPGEDPTLVAPPGISSADQWHFFHLLGLVIASRYETRIGAKGRAEVETLLLGAQSSAGSWRSGDRVDRGVSVARRVFEDTALAVLCLTLGNSPIGKFAEP